MKRDKFPKNVTDLMDRIERNVNANPEELKKSCAELEKYARDNRDDYLKSFSLFYRGVASYMVAELEESMALFSEALNTLAANEDWRLVAKIYNGMGNIADFQGDVSLAIDCYIKGLSVSREHDITDLQYDITSNIANVYLNMGDCACALEMFLECERLREHIDNAHGSSVTIVCANLCLCYLQQDQVERAVDQMERLKKLCEQNPSVMNGISVGILETRLYHELGDFEARDEAIRKLRAHKFGSMNVFDALDELCRHCMLLLEIDKLDEFLELVERIEFLADGPAVEEHVLELRMSYYEKIGDRAAYLEQAARYYVVSRQREKERKKIISHNITTRMRLGEEEARRKEVELSNLQLKQKSERDALTGMNNRHKLNELAELAFHRAYLNGTPLTVEILDIDCYKEYNDNYGHQAGDECLVRIADAICSMEEYDGVHTARYGGDEFVIIYEEYTKQDVEKMVRRLQDKIHSLNIEHQFSRVSDRITVSQGLFHRIPAGGNRVWDFLYGADMSLYGVKNLGKNNFYIGTDFEEVRRRYRDARTQAGKK